MTTALLNPQAKPVIITDQQPCMSCPMGGACPDPDSLP